MDIFRVLTRGANIKKDTRKDGKSVDFSMVDNKAKEDKDNNNARITRELDFFRNKRIINKVANSTTEEENDNEDEVPETKMDSSAVQPKITNKREANALRKSYKGNISGDDVPLPIGSFNHQILF